MKHRRAKMTYLLHCHVCDILYEDVEFTAKARCPLCGYTLVEVKGEYPNQEIEEDDEEEPLHIR